VRLSHLRNRFVFSTAEFKPYQGPVPLLIDVENAGLESLSDKAAYSIFSNQDRLMRETFASSQLSFSLASM
jgi:hypothetical protein